MIADCGIRTTTPRCLVSAPSRDVSAPFYKIRRPRALSLTVWTAPAGVNFSARILEKAVQGLPQFIFVRRSRAHMHLRDHAIAIDN